MSSLTGTAYYAHKSFNADRELLKSCQHELAGAPDKAGKLDIEGNRLSRVKQKLWNQQNDIKDDNGGCYY